jgi:hypothetical protein
MAGNENSGRVMKLPNLKKHMSNMFAHQYIAIWQTILDKAAGGNLEAAIYAIDRELGRPRQEIDARVKSTFSFSPDDLALMRHVTVTDLPAIDAEVKELPEGSNSVDTVPDNDTQSVDNGSGMDWVTDD